MEAEAPICPEGAQRLAPVAGHNALSCILNHYQMVFFRHFHNFIHLTGHAGIMYRHNGPGPVRDSRLNQVLVYVHGVRPYVYKHRGGSPQHKSIRRGHKCIRGHNDLIPGLDSGQQSGHLRGVGAGGGEQTFCGTGSLLNPLIALFGIGPVAADLLVLHALPDILHFLACIGRHIKCNHLLSPYLEFRI